MLPLKLRFDFHDLKFFHKIVYTFSYMNLYSGNTKLRSTHRDSMSFSINVNPSSHAAPSNRGGFSNSYIYKTHLMWNLLPFYTSKYI